MADGAKIATAYYELVASTPGAESQITKAIVPAASSAGGTAGQSLGSRMLAGLKSYAAPITALIATFSVGKFVKDSVTAFTDLAGSVNSLKRITGGSATEVSGLRAAMQLAGMDADSANSTLTIFSKKLQAVQGDSKATAALQDKLGTSITNADGSMKSMSQLLPQVADKFASMPDGVEKTALATQLFGRSGTALLPFLNKGSAGIAELEQKAGSLGLVLDDQSLNTWANYRASVRGLQTTMQGLKVTVGEAVLPAFTAVNNFLTSTVGPAISTAINAIKSSDVIPNIMSTITSALSGLGSTIGPLIPQFFSMASSTSAVSIVFQALGAVLPLLLPLLITLAQVVVSALMPIFSALTPVLQVAADVISVALAGAISFIIPLLQNLADFLSQNTDIVTSVVTAWLIWQGVLGGFKLAELIGQFVILTAQLATQAAAWVANTVAMIASKAETVILAGMYAGEFLMGILRTTAGIIAQTAAWIAHGVALVATKVALGVATAAQWLFNAALNANPIMLVVIAIAALVAGLIWFFTQTTLGQQLWQGFMTWLQAAWTAISTFFSTLWSGIVLVFQTAIQLVSDTVSTVMWTISSVWSAMWGGIASFFTGIWNGIVTGVTWAINMVSSVIGAVIGSISAVWNSVWGGISSFFMGVWNGIIAAVWWLSGAFSSVFNGISGFVSSAFSGVLGAVKGPINGIIGIVNGAIGALNNLHVTIPDWVPGVGGQTWGLSLPRIPQLAQGATVLPKRGGTLVNLAEAGRAETVVDTGKMNALMDMVLNGGVQTSSEAKITVNTNDPMLAATVIAEKLRRA